MPQFDIDSNKYLAIYYFLNFLIYISLMFFFLHSITKICFFNNMFKVNFENIYNFYMLNLFIYEVDLENFFNCKYNLNAFNE